MSTEDQNVDLQTQALLCVGCDKIYTDRGVSGSLSSRPGLDRALARLKPGDTLVVWRLDRLGRSLVHLVRLMETLGRKRVAFQSLTEAINTRSSGGRLVFHMMAALAEFERTLISERTRAGIEAARASGHRVGRRPLLTTSQLEEARSRLTDGRANAKEIAGDFGMHVRTLLRGLDRLDEQDG